MFRLPERKPVHDVSNKYLGSAITTARSVVLSVPFLEATIFLTIIAQVR